MLHTPLLIHAHGVSLTAWRLLFSERLFDKQIHMSTHSSGRQFTQMHCHFCTKHIAHTSTHAHTHTLTLQHTPICFRKKINIHMRVPAALRCFIHRRWVVTLLNALRWLKLKKLLLYLYMHGTMYLLASFHYTLGYKESALYWQWSQGQFNLQSVLINVSSEMGCCLRNRYERKTNSGAEHKRKSAIAARTKYVYEKKYVWIG